MDHVAILRKACFKKGEDILGDILAGRKTIESRWYKFRHSPWGKIEKGDNVYFKDSGEPVSIKAKVKKVISFSGLTPKKVRQILNKYGRDDGIERKKIPEFFKLFKNKKYCLLIFLENPKKIKPFNIDKAGFGNMSAWLTIKDVGRIKT